MHTSKYWIGHFNANARQQRINWDTAPAITHEEIDTILASLQAWQLGETSEGLHLAAAAEKHAGATADPLYVEAIRLFIKEEQKHGNSLGRYIDSINKPRISRDWNDTLFRRVRNFNTNMEIWTVAVIIVESTAQIFYQAMKDATGCALLKAICTDILIDEAYHITFQTERLALIFDHKTVFGKAWRKVAYKYFFYATSLLVWIGHHQLLKAGGNTFASYLKKMKHKYAKTIQKIIVPQAVQWIGFNSYEHQAFF